MLCLGHMPGATCLAHKHCVLCLGHMPGATCLAHKQHRVLVPSLPMFTLLQLFLFTDCQNVRGRFDDVAMTFGTNHPCGRRPGRVVASMKQHVQDRATKYPACFIPTVPAPPPAPVQGPNGKWATPIVVPNTLPFTSSVFSTYWATGAPLYKCDDYANGGSVYVFRCGSNPRILVLACTRMDE